MLGFFSLVPCSPFSSCADSLHLFLGMPVACVWSRYWFYHHCRILLRKSWVFQVSVKGHTASYAFCRRSSPQDATPGSEHGIHSWSFLSQPTLTFLYPNVFSSDDFKKSFDCLSHSKMMLTRTSYCAFFLRPSETSQLVHKQRTFCTLPYPLVTPQHHCPWACTHLQLAK